MLFNKNKKKLTFYVVQHKSNPNKFLTITCNKQDAMDFCYRFIRIQNLDHFKSWCDLRDLNIDDDAAWAQYYNTTIQLEEKQSYLIRKIIYKFNDIAAIMRMFGGCLPLGCNFDTEQEYQYLNYKLATQKVTKDLAQDLQDAFNKAKEELEKDSENEGAEDGE